MTKPHKPKEGERYWHILLAKDGLLEIYSRYYGMGICDLRSLMREKKIGNCFHTRKQAQEKLKEIKAILKK